MADTKQTIDSTTKLRGWIPHAKGKMSATQAEESKTFSGLQTLPKEVRWRIYDLLGFPVHPRIYPPYASFNEEDSEEEEETPKPVNAKTQAKRRTQLNVPKTDKQRLEDYNDRYTSHINAFITRFNTKSQEGIISVDVRCVQWSQSSITQWANYSVQKDGKSHIRFGDTLGFWNDVWCCGALMRANRFFAHDLYPVLYNDRTRLSLTPSQLFMEKEKLNEWNGVQQTANRQSHLSKHPCTAHKDYTNFRNAYVFIFITAVTLRYCDFVVPQIGNLTKYATTWTGYTAALDHLLDSCPKLRTCHLDIRRDSLREIPEEQRQAFVEHFEDVVQDHPTLERLTGLDKFWPA